MKRLLLILILFSLINGSCSLLERKERGKEIENTLYPGVMDRVKCEPRLGKTGGSLKFATVQTMDQFLSSSDYTDLIGSPPNSKNHSGPFILEKSSNKYAIFEKNPYFFNSDQNGARLPYLQTVKVLFSLDYKEQKSLFLGGDTDYYGLRGVDYSDMVELQEKDRFQLYNLGLEEQPRSLILNKDSVSLSDQFIEIISTVIDGTYLMNNITFGFGESLIEKTSDTRRAKVQFFEQGWLDHDKNGFLENSYGEKVLVEILAREKDYETELIGQYLVELLLEMNIEATLGYGDPMIGWDILISQSGEEELSPPQRHIDLYKKISLGAYDKSLANMGCSIEYIFRE